MPETLRFPAVSGLRIERDGGVVRVTLAKPERRNAFDAALINELRYAFTDLEGERDVRVVVLAGDGPSFCAGADVEWQRASISLDSEDNVEDALRLFHMLVEVDACPPPLVARVHGHALGGGMGLAACADVVIAAPDTTFGFTEVRLGIAPAVISPFVMAKIGASATRRFFVTGERFDAQTALRIGLVHEVVEDLDAAVERVVGDILKSGPEATRAAKKLGRERTSEGEVLARIAAARRISAEGQEGLRAFLEKRKPDWSA
jgi:methylglutaconyl-CoA hydratase